jgi:hypothetical protein
MAETEPGREGDRLRCRAWVPYKSHTQSSADNTRSLPLAPCLCPSKRAQTGPRLHRGCARGDQIAVPPLCHAQPFQSPHACTHRPVSTDLPPSNHLSTAAVCSYSSGSTTSTELVAGLHVGPMPSRFSVAQSRESSLTVSPRATDDQKLTRRRMLSSRVTGASSGKEARRQALHNKVCDGTYPRVLALLPRSHSQCTGFGE